LDQFVDVVVMEEFETAVPGEAAVGVDEFDGE
jgi:hypothetical protein